MKSTLGPHSGPSNREVSDRCTYGGSKRAWHLALETICIKHMDITCNPVNRNENYLLRAKRIVPKESLMTAGWTNFTLLAFFSALLRTRSGTWADELRSPLTTGKYISNQISLKTLATSQSKCCLNFQFHVQRPAVRLNRPWRLVQQKVVGFHIAATVRP